MSTDQTDLERSEEIIREAVFRRLHEEVPYWVRQRTDSWSLSPRNELVIHHTLLVGSESQKRMVIGSGGSVVAQIGAQARKQLELVLSAPVHLYVRVAIDKSAKKNRRRRMLTPIEQQRRTYLEEHVRSMTGYE